MNASPAPPRRCPGHCYCLRQEAGTHRSREAATDQVVYVKLGLHRVCCMCGARRAVRRNEKG